MDYIFLDLDGPILDGKNRHYQCYVDIINKYGGEPLDIDTYWELKRSKIKRDIVLKKSCFQATYDDFLKEWMTNIEKDTYLKLDKLKPDVVKTLSIWKEVSDNLFLVTMRQSRKSLLKELRDLGIHDFFDAILDCPLTRKNTKYEALRNLKFETAIFIGDTEEDINTAKILNIKSIGVTNGLRKKEFLEADYFFQEIKDIDLNKLEL